MILQLLCTKNQEGVTRFRSNGMQLKVYFNRYHGQIQFPKIFNTRFGFKKGVKITMYEHPGDPLNKFIFAIAKSYEEKEAFELKDWGNNKSKKGYTCIGSNKFFKTMGIPEGEKTTLLKSTQFKKYGEKGFHIILYPYYFDGRFLFEGDVTRATPTKRK